MSDNVSSTGWTFQFLHKNNDAKNRVSTPYYTETQSLAEAAKEAKDQACEIGASVGFFLKGMHTKFY